MKNFQNILFIGLLNLFLQLQLFAMEIKAPTFGVAYGSATATGTRHHDNEDRHFVYPLEREAALPSLVAAVFDGHGGGIVSDYLSENFLSILKECMGPEISLQVAVEKAFKVADERVKSTINQGSTALVVVIHNGNFLVAHAGDSRAVVYRYDGENRSFLATKDHKPTTLGEEQRIKNAGGTVIFSYKAHRVDGKTLLSVSRGIGDYLKDGTKDKGLTCEPTILEKKIDAGYKFIILASDGVWDVLTSQEAIHEVKTILSLCGPKKAAQKLVAVARERGSNDDLTVIVIRITGLE